MIKPRMSLTRGITNQHGTEAKGEPWNKQTIHGWKLTYVKLRMGRGWGRRFILYYPSGSCWYLDFYLLSMQAS